MLPADGGGVPPPPSGHAVTDAKLPPRRIVRIPICVSTSAVCLRTGRLPTRPHAPGCSQTLEIPSSDSSSSAPRVTGGGVMTLTPILEMSSAATSPTALSWTSG